MMPRKELERLRFRSKDEDADEPPPFQNWKKKKLKYFFAVDQVSSFPKLGSAATDSPQQKKKKSFPVDAFFGN